MKQRKILEEKYKKLTAIRTRIYEEICKAPGKLDGGDKREFIAFVMEDLQYNYDEKLVFETLGIPTQVKRATETLCKLPFEEAIKKIVLMAMSKDVKLGEYRMKIHKTKDDSLFNNAKRLKVNIAAIEKEIETAEAQKKNEAAKDEKSTKGGGKKANK
jgi:hypothetical protein